MTKHGSIDASQYDRELFSTDIADLFSQINKFYRWNRATSRSNYYLEVFFRRWNVRLFWISDRTHVTSCPNLLYLLDAAVDRNNQALVKFIYRRLAYDDQFYNLERVRMSSVHSPIIRDLLIKWTLKFSDDYKEPLRAIRNNLSQLAFNRKAD